MTHKINKLLAANRGEIATRIFRAATELGISTVAIYTYEDRYSLHRYKADESYQIGEENDPLKPYLDIEAIISLAKAKGVDAIHPGYGFLSENVQLARRCQEEGIIFVGPRPEVMEQLGDKIASKIIAKRAGVPLIEDSQESLTTFEIAKKEANRIGYPVMMKASAGGGGRGMRVVRDDIGLEKAFREARNEAKNAFGDDTVFLEKFIEEPKHIEVQIMGDNFGNLVHLHERDCSVQRRFQKVVEVAPSFLPPETKAQLHEYALNITREVNYNNVGTVEFLVDKDNKIYFIEVNPRIQVEHTITEEITGIDIVRNQILIAEGHLLADKSIYILHQDDIKIHGFAIQCRITTEDPVNQFKPDYGTLIAYRNAGGFGIRLDEGSCYQGARISPFFDSMLVKVCASGRTFRGAAGRMVRALQEFRIRGVKTNIGFLYNVVRHEQFLKGEATVKFIENHPELMQMPRGLDRSTKILRYLAEVIVNGNPDVQADKIIANKKFRTPKAPQIAVIANKLTSTNLSHIAPVEPSKGMKTKLSALGREKFVQWLREEKPVYYTDTTLRDAHQSLLATRVRTMDMLKVAENFAKSFPQLFSMEVWGGATFDVAMRFLKECPWDRLRAFRQAMPDTLLQMLLRGSNAVGYTSYPNNLVAKFVEASAKNGIDVFRIFDSLNWLDAMKVSIDAVLQRTDALAEGTICYTGEMLDKNNQKYTLQYYLDLARRLEDTGIHLLAIKDMAGLLKPYTAELLVTELHKALSIPIHLHTHDTSSIQSATYLRAIDAGVNVVDVALAAMSGLTSQPNFNSLVAAMQHHPRNLPPNSQIDLQTLNKFSTYWEDIREYYYPFESDLKAGTAEVYDNEIPGGQYSNLRPQAISLGLEDKFEAIKRNYVVANQLFGDIVKVTPSSKVVGDLALFMTANNLTAEDILERGSSLSFPESVKGMLRGEIGQPHGGFPEKFVQVVLKDEKPHFELTGALLPPTDFEAEMTAFKQQFAKADDFPSANLETDFLSYKMYPKVFEEYHQSRNQYGDLACLPTLAFFYGMKQGEEIIVEMVAGKSIIIKYLGSIPTDTEGMRTISFELNGQTRRIKVKDKAFKSSKVSHRKAKEKGEIGTPLQGRIANVMVKKGDTVQPNQPLFVIEAMKMESTITANAAGVVQEIVLDKGTMVAQDDLVVVVR
jgi:pyruvate carboxylase